MTQGFFQFSNSIINEILNFTTSDFDLLFIDGAKGSAKSETIEKAMGEFNPDTLIFQHFCFENTVIDDFLLNFYDELRNFTLAQKISLKKFTTDNFKEKVSHYFKAINANCIIIVENFEKSAANAEIVDFLAHLASYSNVKIIILSREEEKSFFRFKKIKTKNLSIQPLSKEDFSSKLLIMPSKLYEPDPTFINHFYEVTNGLELYLKMTMKYCEMSDVAIKDLISEYTRRVLSNQENFENFLVAKFVSLIPLSYLSLFKILCSLRHPVSNNFLDEYKMNNPNCIEYLSKNFLINYFRDEIFVKDYFRHFITGTFSISEKIDYYKKIVEIYENELTKSPKDRLLRLSRESIRKEIVYFSVKTPNVTTKTPKALLYLGLSNSNITSPAEEAEPVVKKSRLVERFGKIMEKKTTFTKEENELLISKRLKDSNQKSLIAKNRDKNKTLIIELINESRKHTQGYRYSQAITSLLRARSIDYDNEFKIEIFTLIAKNYDSLNDYTTALEYYDEALKHALCSNDQRICEIEFSIASTNKNLYKVELAKQLFTKIADNEAFPKSYRAKAAIEAGELEEADSNLKDAIVQYEKALELSLGKNKELVCKSYYKLGLLYDENQDIENAIKYYQKNYMTSSEKQENKYYSISLTNLALIYIEQMKYKEASEFLKMALIFDTENNDLENMYFSQKELAKLYSKMDKQSAIGYYRQALETALELKDVFKEALIYFEMGEFYYDKGDDQRALKNFLDAKDALKYNPKDENIARIDSRIKDIKIRLDDSAYSVLIEEYGRKFKS